MRRPVTVALAAALAVPIGLAAGPASAAPAAPSERICFRVSGEPGSFAIVNLTPVDATAPGNGQLISSDVTTPPEASNVNFKPGSVDPNVAIAKVGTDGRVCYVNSTHANVHVIADDLGSLSATGFAPTTTGAPVRRVDTRTGLGGAVIAASERRCFDVGGAAGDVAVVNLTPVGATRLGNGVLVPDDASIATPTASNVNFGAGTVDPNVALATVGASGKVCFVNSTHGPVHLVADELGTIKKAVAKPAVTGGVPKRVVDTRLGQGGGMVVPSGRLCFAVAGSAGDVAFVNLTPVDATRAGYGQLVSSDVTTPVDASNVNFDRRTFDPNVAAAVIGADGQVCFVNSTHAAVHLVADHLMSVAGSAFTPPSGTGAMRRVLDTRLANSVVYSNANAAPTAIDCLDAAGCVASVGTSPTLGLTVPGDGSAPRLGTAPATTPAVPSPAQALKCALVDKCIAVGTSQTTPDARTAFLTITADRGATWTAPALPRAVDSLHDLTCASSIRCLVAGENTDAGATTGVLFGTGNSGTSWTEITLPTSVDQITAIDCPSGTLCLMLAKDGDTPDGEGPSRILRSTNAGVTWTTVSVPSGTPGDLECASTTVCVAFTSGTSSVRHVSADGGLSWTSRPFTAGRIVDVECPAADRCVATGTALGAARPGTATVLTSTDQFATTGSLDIATGGTGTAGAITDLACISASACYAVGTTGNGSGGFVAKFAIA